MVESTQKSQTQRDKWWAIGAYAHVSKTKSATYDSLSIFEDVPKH